jgi:diguanylate cyclase (GGDEF)-like protein/PAS domain S-box-containing protein
MRTENEGEALSRFVCESVTEFAIFTISLDGGIATWNPGAERTFGYSRQNVIGRNFSLIFTNEDIAGDVPAAELIAAVANGRVDRDGWHVRADGSRFWGTNTVQPLTDSTGRQIGFTKIVRDSTERYNAALALRQSEERFRLLVDSVDNYAIFSVGANGLVTLWNAGAERTYGYTESEALGRPCDFLFTQTDVADGVPAAELDHVRERGAVENERWQLRKDGTRFIAQRSVTLLKADPATGPQGFSVIAHDITERRANEERMWDQAFHDTLTGLANRALLIEHLQNAVARSKRRPEKRFAVLFLDLDDFKTVNDDVGHILADGVLAQVAKRLRASVRPEDVVARLGGDEFTILQNDVSGVQDAVTLAGRIHGALAVPFSVGGQQAVVSTSVGIALGGAALTTVHDVLRDADVAMYEAKGRGPAQTVVYDEGMRARVVSRHLLESDIRGAAERNELFVEYQPIFDLKDLRLAGFEALVRWRHPERGILQPSQIIPSAEDSGAIIAIDRWVLRAACDQLHAWKTAFSQAASLTVSVNMSAKQFTHEDLCETIARALDASGVSAAALKLEITESTLMEKSEKVFDTLAAIRALDVEIMIDDFGTGYSSLSYLRMFPVSTVKVDRSFIIGMDAHADRAEMVRAIVTLAHNLHLSVVAEGVETAAELAALQTLSCEQGQGFFLARPLGADAARALIERGGTAGAALLHA